MAQGQVQLPAWHVAWEWDTCTAPEEHRGVTGSSKSNVLGQEAWLACGRLCDGGAAEMQQGGCGCAVSLLGRAMAYGWLPLG